VGVKCKYAKMGGDRTETGRGWVEMETKYAGTRTGVISVPVTPSHCNAKGPMTMTD